MSDRLVLGVDGGGTSTRVAICTEQGQLLGLGVAGPGNYHNVGLELVRQHIATALAEAWQSAATSPREFSAVFLGMASVVSDADRNAIRELAARLPGSTPTQVGIDHDLRIALAGGLVGEPGIVLIAGTGSSCYGRSSSGDTWRAGGWGDVLDDLGGGGWLGLQAMIAAVHAYDRRGPMTELLAQVQQALQLDDFTDIMHRVDAEGFSRRERASLAKLVTEAAQRGDGVAKHIIDQGTRSLAAMIATVNRQLELDRETQPVPVVVSGGLAAAGEVFMGPLRTAVDEQVPSARLVAPKLPPVLGAALLAIELLGSPCEPQTIENLQLSATTIG